MSSSDRRTQTAPFGLPTSSRTARAAWIARPVATRLPGDVVSGTVAGVYSRACNVRIRSGDLARDLGLVTVLAPGAGMVPHGVGLRDSLPPFTRMGIRSGARVELSEGGLLLPAVGLEVRLDAPRIWEPVPRIAARGDGGAVRLALHAAVTEAAHQGPAGGFSELLPMWGDLMTDAVDLSGLSPLGVRAAPAIAMLVRGLREHDDEVVERAGRALLGLGPGLTPSGDDLLTGLLGSLVAATGSRTVRDIGHRLAEQASVKTTLVGAAYLRSASRGELTQSMGELLVAALGGHRPAVSRAARACAGVGETSGVDGLLGVVLATALIEPNSVVFNVMSHR